MPHFGTLSDYQFKNKADDIRGANLRGVDGSKLGTIEDVIFEHGRGDIRYVVVDTGGWWSSKRFMVPADRVHRCEDNDDFQVDVVKEHIERYFPPYDSKHIESDRAWNDYENNYRNSTREYVWKDDDRVRRDNRDLETSGGVMHREGSDRVLTPEPHEMPMSGGSQSSERDRNRAERNYDETRNASIKDRMKQAMGSYDGDWKPDALEHDKGQRPDRNIADAEKRAGDYADNRGYNQLEGRNETFAERYMGADPSQRDQVRVAGGSRGEHHIADNAPRAWDQDPEVHEEHAQDFNMRSVQQGNTQTGHMHENRDYQLRNQGERWNRFEELLRRNRVDIESHCRHCEPARDDKDAA